MTRTQMVLSHAAALGAGVLLSVVFLPKPEPRIEYREKERVVEVVKEVEVEKWKDRIVEVKVKDTKTRIVTKVVEVEKPTGEKVKTTEIVETDDSKEKTSVDLTREGEKVVERIVEKLVYRDVFVKQEPVLSKWMVTGLVGIDDLSLSPNVIYGGMVQRRVVGPVWAGGWITSLPNGGIAVSAEF